MNNIPWNREPSLEELARIPYKSVNPEILHHDFEKRGFVPVPLDYSRAESPKLKIFYRFMPSQGLPLTDRSRPIVVVVNGGPGMASHFYRAYDFDYTGKVEAKVDYLGELLKHFRVLIMDQRGTDGNSNPLDLDNSDCRPEIIARYFDSHHIARDQQEVINAVIPKDELFFMIVQSYGGMVGMSYMTLPEIVRMPKGICFSAAAMPHGDFKKQAFQRRFKQKEFNQKLKQTRPELPEKILQLKKRFEDHQLPGNQFHHLWTFLGQGEDGDWQLKLEKKLDSLLQADRKQLEEFIAEEGGANFLNYVLSNPMFTPNYTDATLAKEKMKQIPYEEEWMLDECLVCLTIGRDGTWRQEVIEAMDANPHPGTHYASPEEIQKGFRRTRVLISIAEGDVFLPAEVVRENASLFQVPGITEEILLPGGHKAIFLPKGVKAFHEWTQRIGAGSSTRF